MRVKKSAVLGEYVYDQIKDMILTRKIKPGEKIQEQQIEQELGVSRTPVREAVRKLQNEGIIELYPNRHAEVATFDEEAIQQLGMVRITMDCLAAQQAIQNGSNRDFDQLKELAQKCEEANTSANLYDQIQYDTQFHMLLVEISENKVLIDIQKNLVLRTQLLQTTLLDTGMGACDIKHHSEILDGLYARDLPSVHKAIQAHLCPFYHINPDDIRTVTYS